MKMRKSGSVHTCNAVRISLVGFGCGDGDGASSKNDGLEILEAQMKKVSKMAKSIISFISLMWREAHSLAPFLFSPLPLLFLFDFLLVSAFVVPHSRKLEDQFEYPNVGLNISAVMIDQ